MRVMRYYRGFPNKHIYYLMFTLMTTVLSLTIMLQLGQFVYKH